MPQGVGAVLRLGRRAPTLSPDKADGAKTNRMVRSVVGRDGIKNGFYQSMCAEAQAQGVFTPLTVEERQASRRDTMAARPEGADVWIFGYGSLMWNPAFHHVEKRLGVLHGFHRSFCLQTPIGRGTIECPGLVLGLDRGGSVKGMAFRIAEENITEELDVIWSREMLGGAYRPAWVKLIDPEGVRFDAITFVMRRNHPRYTGRLELDETARQIAKAAGPLGPCADYLENTVAAMDAIGIADGPMHALWDRVQHFKAEETAR